MEDIVPADIFFYGLDIVDVSMIGKLARRSVEKHVNTVRQKRDKSHICYDSNINALFKAICFPPCDQFIERLHDLERHLATCKEIVNHVFPKNVYQLQKTLFDKLHSFNILHSDDQKVFQSMVIFNFESICVQEDKFCDTDTTKWTGKHLPISVSVLFNLI